MLTSHNAALTLDAKIEDLQGMPVTDIERAARAGLDEAAAGVRTPLTMAALGRFVWRVRRRMCGHRADQHGDVEHGNGCGAA